MRSFGLGLLCLIAFVSSGNSQDWPQFRGPNGDGHYSGKPLPTTWGPDTNVVWKKPIAGRGWSSPIYVKGKLYLTSAIPQKSDDLTSAQALMALCLDAKTGDVLWEKELFQQEPDPKMEIHSKNSHASPTPVSDGERIFFHFGHQGTAATDLNGKILWKETKWRYQPQHGNGGSPVLMDDLLVFNCDGKDKQFVVALDKTNGELRWNTPRNIKPKLGFSFSTPAAIKTPKGDQIISSGSDLIAGYEPKSGKELWRSTYVGWSLIQRPLYGHGLVYFCTGYVKPVLQAVNPDQTGDLTQKVAWTVKSKVPNTPSLLLVGDELYMIADSGWMSCLNAKTGEVIWEERLQGAFSASPIYSDGKIFVTSEEGNGYVVDASKKFKQIRRNDMKEKTFASFVPVDGALFIRTESSLYRFEERK